MFGIIVPAVKGAILAAAIFSAHPAHVLPPAVPPAAAVVHKAPAPAAVVHTAPATYTVEPGDSLSSIAAAHHLAWPRLWAGNRSVLGPDPDLIQPGRVLRLTHLPAYAVPPASSSPPGPGNLSATQEMPSTRQFGGYASVSGSVTPGSSFESCVISRESSGNSQVTNASGHYGLYQFSASTWAAYGGSPASFGHASAAQQQQVFRTAMSHPGGAANWSPYDGC